MLWGFYHGIVLLVERHLGRYENSFLGRVQKHRVWPVVKTVLTFHLVCLGWIIFRAQSIQDALRILNNLASFEVAAPVAGGTTLVMLCVAALSHFMRGKVDLEQLFVRLPSPVKGLAYALVTITIYVFFTTEQRFIYFQF